MRIILLMAAITTVLAACQSTQESMYSAERVCTSAGLRPGTRAFDNCANAAYAENRRQSDQAATAVAVGTAVGVVGGAVVGASAARSNDNYYYYGRRGGYYYHPRCNRWGCW
ncbi:hypothetical protein [Pseudochelatococcus sp. G4_1912]|jgi:hypothetical protein|uniref:hypothetical protein n=1 Tax=Pseudochelatococcus sp. G4_1912 TaxID=3114288 RepID=UPI0039C5ECD8